MSSGTDLDPQGAPVFVTNQVGSSGTPSHVTVDSGSVTVSNFPATQGVTAAALPLPSGASTEGTLALIKAKTDNIDVALSTRTKPGDTQTVGGTVTANAGSNLNTSLLALEAGGNLAAAKTDLDSIVANQTSGGQKTQVTNFPATQPVSATALPLPTGAATDSSLTNGNLRGSVSVSNLPATQPISAAALPLPSNAAQETGGNLASILTQLTSLLATQTNGTQLVTDSLLATAVQQLQQSVLAQTSVEMMQLRAITSQSGQFFPVPEVPAFLGGG